MATVASTVAANGYLYTPHVVLKQVPQAGYAPSSVLPVAPAIYNQVMSAQTASTIRQAMWAVTQYGTGSAGLPAHNGYYTYNSPAHMGGKTGTAHLPSGRPHAWWIGISPDDVFRVGDWPGQIRHRAHQVELW